MSQVPVTFTLNQEIVLMFRDKVRDRDRSKTIETLLHNFLEMEPENKDELVLMKEIETLHDQKEQLALQISTKKTLLEKVRCEKEAARIEAMKQSETVAEGIINSGVLRRLGR